MYKFEYIIIFFASAWQSSLVSLSLFPSLFISLSFMQRSENKESEVAKFYNKLAQPDADRRDEVHVWKSTYMYMYMYTMYLHVCMQ